MDVPWARGGRGSEVVAAVRIENVVHITRSPEYVFDYLSDQSTEVQWNPDCVSMERLTDGPVGIGTRFRAKWQQGPAVETEITVYDRPRRWTYVNGGPISCDLRVTLEPCPDRGTRLTSCANWPAHGLTRLWFPVFISPMRQAEAQAMQNAKRALEQRLNGQRR